MVSFSIAGEYLPSVAADVSFARCRKARCALETLAGFPDQAFCGAACRPRPYEKDNVHGARTFAAYRLIASRLIVASSSDWPPERNTIPGTAAGTVARKHSTVRRATSSGPARFEASLADRTMFGLRSIPSRRTRCAASWMNTVRSVLIVTSLQRSIEW